MEQRWARAHLADEPVTAKPRHHQVGNDQIRGFGKRSLQRLHAIGDRDDAVLSAEHLGDETLHFGIVLGHQDQRTIR
ncbi:hypothetical protein D3C78_751870 [compost metagenome]